MEKIKPLWLIIGLISLLLLFKGSFESTDTDKKTAQAGTNTALVGAVGLASTATFGLKGFAWVALSRIFAWPLVTLIAFLPNLFSGWVNAIKNIFAPTPTIPIWIYIGGFAVIALMFISRKKG